MKDDNKDRTTNVKREDNRMQSFLPYHIAAIAWIFLPGGNVPKTVADVGGLGAAIQAYNATPSDQVKVTQELNTVFQELQNFLKDDDNKEAFVTGRKNFQKLLSAMNNLWDGADSDMTPALVAKIASLS